MNGYRITIDFSTERALTGEELDTLKSILALQIEEPQDLEGNEEEWTASNIAVMVASK